MTDAREVARATPRVWPPLALAAGLLAVWAWHRLPDDPAEDPAPAAAESSSEPDGPPAPAPYEPSARALLGGLDPGEAVVEGWTVVRVEGPLDDRRIKITLAREHSSLVLWVVPNGASEHEAPLATRDHELFYDTPDPPVDAEEIARALEYVAERVRAHE